MGSTLLVSEDPQKVENCSFNFCDIFANSLLIASVKADVIVILFFLSFFPPKTPVISTHACFGT